jgi:sterol desaturase/sphingolipid hydroxylase (fatty acid hydroxylase superfamily)
VYELLHSASHLPSDHWLAQNRVVQWVSRHHRIHHDPKLMRTYNFNFALPLFDWLFGTIYRERHAVDDEVATPEPCRPEAVPSRR